MKYEKFVDYIVSMRKQLCAEYLKTGDKEDIVTGLKSAEKRYITAYKDHHEKGLPADFNEIRKAYEDKIAEQMAQNAGDLPEYYRARAQELVRGSVNGAIDRLNGIAR